MAGKCGLLKPPSAAHGPAAHAQSAPGGAASEAGKLLQLQGDFSVRGEQGRKEAPE